jgi:colanic acid biosynthesis glycosyl transferase WcaI
MRILIYSYNYHPELIGIAPLMTELAEGMASRGHKVRVITAMPNYPQRRIYAEYQGKIYLTEEKNGVTIQRSYVWIRPQPGLIDRLLLDASFVLTSSLQALKGWRPDVIVLTVPPLPVSIPAALLSWFYRCPIVLNVQDILPDAAIQVGLLKNKVLIKTLQLVEKFAYRTATIVSVIADGFVDNLKMKGVPSHKITQIPNWVDIDFIYPLPQEESLFRQKYNLQEKFVVMYSGNIALTQGLQTAIEAASLLQHIQDIVFVIVGEESALAELEQIRGEKELQNVLLLPFQPREHLPDMLAAANVGLVLQKHNVISFNMPSKIPVLLASGRAIIASVPAAGTAAKVVKDSQGGLVICPENPTVLAEAVRSLHQDLSLTQKLGDQGRQYAVQNFAFEKILDCYESLLTDPSTGPTDSLATHPEAELATAANESLGSEDSTSCSSR